MLDKVFYIDDDVITHMMFKMLNKKVALAEEVISAYHGMQALNYYENLEDDTTIPPQLIFLDLNMPVMGGWEFMEQFNMKYLPRFIDTKVVIATSSLDPTDKVEAKKYSNIVDFIHKPIQMDMLVKIKKLVS